MPKTSDSKKFPFAFWVGYGVAYGIIGAIAALNLSSPQILAVIALASVVISTVCLAAIWSVYGNGTFLKRLISALSVCLIVFVGIFIGGNVVFADSGMETGQMWRITMAILAALPAYCAMAQVPHWIMRVAFGWQFNIDNRQAAPVFELRELFSITFFVAIAIAGVSLAAQLYCDAVPGMVDLMSEANRDPDGFTIAMSERQVHGMVAFAFAMYGSVFLFASIFTVPLFYLVFLTKDLSSGIAWFAGLAASGTAAILTLGFVLGGGVGGANGGFGLLIAFLASWLTLFLTPWIHCRNKGIRLKTIKTINASQRLSKSNQGFE